MYGGSIPSEASRKHRTITYKLNGLKYWRLKYRFGGTEKRLALGVYPVISLACARKADGGEQNLNVRNPAILRCT